MKLQFPVLALVILGSVLSVTSPAALFAQSIAESEAEREADSGTDSTGSGARVETLGELDRETAKLGEAIIRKLRTLGSDLRLRFSVFSFEGADTSLGSYLTNQLAAILVNKENSNYLVITGPGSGSPSQNDYTLSGEILQLGNTLRIYAKLIRTQDTALNSVWNSDIIVSTFIEDLIASASSGSSVRRDSYEPDSQEAPVTAELGAWISRTIHDNDQDWFLVSAPSAGILILETGNSSFDPVMELYDVSDGSRIEEDDDGGEGSNPRIEVNAEAGQSFIAKVRGYGSSETGNYQFRATIEAITEDNSEPNDTMETATPLVPGSGPVNGSFRSRSDVDFYRIEIPAPGNRRLTIYTESRIDTLLSLYDSNGELIDEDDDSGNGGNARISREVGTGTFYIKVHGYEGSRGSYTLHFEIDGSQQQI